MAEKKVTPKSPARKQGSTKKQATTRVTRQTRQSRIVKATLRKVQ